jgi:hypothetical protein
MSNNFLGLLAVILIMLGSIILVDEHHHDHHDAANQNPPSIIHYVEQEKWVDVVTFGAIGYLLGDR